MSAELVNGYIILKEIYYTKDHEWVKIENKDMARVGITDYAQKSLHEVVYVGLPKVGLLISKMEPIGTVESIKSVSDIYSPLSGQIIEVNEKLIDSPELVNKSPYVDGWIAALKPKILGKELKSLMTSEQYAEYIKELLEK
jgi:glycine cleavage system H protein